MNPALTRWITLLLAITSAMAVATVYFAQPLLESMAADLGVAQQQIGWVVGATQAGYAWALWRPYACCERKGQVFLRSVDF